MKKTATGLFAAVVASTIATGALAKDYVYATFVPPRHALVLEGLEPMIADIKKATNGEVNFVLKAGAQLFSAETSIASVGEGLADVTTGVPAYTPAMLPHQSIIGDLQMFVADPRAGGLAHIDLMLNDCPECQGEFKKIGAMVLAPYATGPSVLFCNKVMKTVADMKGAKIRTTGGQGRLAQLMGGTAVRMGTPEMPSAIERGQIDCIMGAPSWIKSYGLFDYIKSIYAYPMGTYSAPSLVIMNVKTWQGFTPAQRKAMMPALAKGTARAIVDGYAKADQDTLAEAATRNIPIAKGEPAMEEVMKKLLEGEKKVIADNAKRFNVKDPEAIIAKFLASNAKWEKALAGIPLLDTAGYEKVLWEQFYSNIDPEKL